MTNSIPGLLDAWVSHLAKEKLLMGEREALTAELSTWLQLLFAGAGGDTGASAELFRFVALHCKSLGHEGRPASAVVMQVASLKDLLLGQTPAPDPKLLQLVHELIRVAADAQALGQGEKLKEKAIDELKHRSPVFTLPNVVLGCLVGPMRAELLDALFARVLTECARHGIDRMIVDISSADEPDDRFFRTIHGLLTSPDVPPVSVIISGVRDLDATTMALRKLGVDTPRLRLVTQLGEVLGPL
jgi:hypothetical protein